MTVGTQPNPTERITKPWGTAEQVKHCSPCSRIYSNKTKEKAFMPNSHCEINHVYRGHKSKGRSHTVLTKTKGIKLRHTCYSLVCTTIPLPRTAADNNLRHKSIITRHAKDSLLLPTQHSNCNFPLYIRIYQPGNLPACY